MLALFFFWGGGGPKGLPVWLKDHSQLRSLYSITSFYNFLLGSVVTNSPESTRLGKGGVH